MNEMFPRFFIEICTNTVTPTRFRMTYSLLAFGNRYRKNNFSGITFQMTQFLNSNKFGRKLTFVGILREVFHCALP